MAVRGGARPGDLPDGMDEEGKMISRELLDILVCPACRGDLEYDEGASTLTCHACRLRYRIEDDIPIMLVDEAERLDRDEPERP